MRKLLVVILIFIFNTGWSQDFFWTYPALKNPLVGVLEVINIGTNSATFRGNVVSDGGASIFSQGFVYGTSTFPDLNDNVVYGTNFGLGYYEINVTGLTASTTYYVGAFAENIIGLDLDNTGVSFTTGTPITIPTVTTTNVTSITTTTASSGGNVTSDGGATVTSRGVCYSTSTPPTTANNTTSDGSGTGSYTSSISGLTAGTTYYLRAYAINSNGTGYGEIKQFTTNTVSPESPTYNETNGGYIVRCPNADPYTQTFYVDVNHIGFTFGYNYSGAAWDTLIVDAFDEDYYDNGDYITFKDGTTTLTSLDMPYKLDINALSAGDNTTLNMNISVPESTICPVTEYVDGFSGAIFYRIKDVNGNIGEQKKTSITWKSE